MTDCLMQFVSFVGQNAQVLSPVSEDIGQAFLNFFGNPYVATFLIAMLPIVELRGAIPFGYLYVAQVSEMGMGWFGAFAMGYLGSAIICPLILLLFIPLLNWLKKTRLFRRPATWLENKFSKKAEKVRDKAILKANKKQDKNLADMTEEERAAILANVSEEEKAATEKAVEKRIMRAKFIGVFTFVAIPLPFTGVWTGSAVAAFLKLDFKKALLAVVLGNLVAAIAITLLTVFAGGLFL